MLLKNKTAVVYGAGGAVGSAVTRPLAREGASVLLAGRIIDKLGALTASGLVCKTRDSSMGAANGRRADPCSAHGWDFDGQVQRFGGFVERESAAPGEWDSFDPDDAQDAVLDRCCCRLGGQPVDLGCALSLGNGPTVTCKSSSS